MTDLRLAPMALGCWAAALTTLHTGTRVGLAALGIALLATALTLRLNHQWRWIAVSALIGVACGTGVTAARLAAAQAPHLTTVVAARLTATVELTVRDDPRPARAKTGRATTWVVPARLTAVTLPPGVPWPPNPTDSRPPNPPPASTTPAHLTSNVSPPDVLPPALPARPNADPPPTADNAAHESLAAVLPGTRPPVGSTLVAYQPWLATNRLPPVDEARRVADRTPLADEAQPVTGSAPAADEVHRQEGRASFAEIHSEAGPGWAAQEVRRAAGVVPAADEVRRGVTPALAGGSVWHGVGARTEVVELGLGALPASGAPTSAGSAPPALAVPVGTGVVPLVVGGGEGVRVVADVRVLVLASDDGWRGLVPGQRVRAQVRFGASRGGDLTAAVLSSAAAPVLVGVPPWYQGVAARLRAGLQRACEPLHDAPGGLLPGLVVGDTSRLLPEVEQDFQETGMTHLNAVSGSNVAIVVGCVVFLARWCRMRPRWTAVLAGVAVVGFVILARPSPSVVRAAAMGGVGLLALAGGRSRAALPALCAAVIVLVVVDPELAGDAGFALSVLATSGLLLLAPPMRDWLRRKGVPAGAAEALAVPASAQLACAPIVAGLSGTISLIAVPANLLAVPAIAPATLIGVVAAGLSPVWPAAAEFAAWLGGWPAWWLVKVAEVGSGVPAGVVPWPAGVGGALLLATLTVVVLLGFRYRRVRLVACVVAVAVVVGALPVRLVTGGWPPSGWLVVTCDVGQGDAVVLRAGPDAAVVVDVGPEPSGVDGCLRGLEVSAVPMAFLSHYHLDHIGGLAGLFKHHPGRLVTPAWAEPASGRQAVLAAAAQARVPVTAAGPGTVWTVGAVTLRVLSTSPVSGTRSDPNNNSLILLATVSGVNVLLLGDAETEQQALLRREHGMLRPDIVKVAHHGSAYQDTEFLESLRPRVALVSVGEDNGYGHPHPSVLALFERHGARVCRTDRDGDVAVAVDGDTGELFVVRR